MQRNLPKRKHHALPSKELQAGLDVLLSRVATPVAAGKEQPKAKPRPKHRSRFFFRLMEDELADLKKAVAPKEVSADNKEAIKFAESLSKTLPPTLQSNLEVVRDFFINEIAPLTLALGAGSIQAAEAIKAVTGSDVEPSTFAKFEKMAHQAVMIRMALFLENYLSLPKGASKELLPAVAIKRKPSTPAPSGDPDNTSGLRRETKGLKRVLQQVLDGQGLAAQGGSHGPIEG